MDHEKTLGGLATPVGVTEAPASAESSPDSQSVQDPTKNLKAEFNRKISKINDKIDQLLAAASQKQVQSPVVETEQEEPEISKYVDARLKAKDAEQVRVSHQSQLQEVKRTFPELDEDSDQFDPDFYKTVDKYYTKFISSDPTDSNALQDALELAATKSGRAERILKEKLIKDEARRSRILSEGIGASRETKTEKKLQLNEKGLARIGIKASELEEFIKNNKDRYGDL